MLDPAEENLKVPAWLNDLTMYHNRGDTTFTGEDSQYGDFFGLDDLFTERPEVVDGMIDIYQTWVEDFDIDGFRIDTMKHVNDEFWQKFGPGDAGDRRRRRQPGLLHVRRGRPRRQRRGREELHLALHDPRQDAGDPRLPVPGRRPRLRVAGSSATRSSRTFFANDDWYTDADSNAYSLPTFLGNHDMGRIGRFLQADNPGADDAELLARDRLAHELMYFSRGNPVVYYGDEQGFTGHGGDQVARQTMFASQVPEYLDDDLLGTDRTHAAGQLRHRRTRCTRRSAGWPRSPTTTRRCATAPQQVRYASERAGRLRLLADRPQAAARVRRRAQQQRVGRSLPQVPTYIRKGSFRKVYGAGPAQLDDRRRHRTLPVTLRRPVDRRSTCPTGRIPRSQPRRRRSAWPAPAPADGSRGRMHVAADVEGDSFYEVTFQREGGPRRAGGPSASTTPRRTRSSTTSRRCAPGTARLLPRGGARQRRPHARLSGPRARRCPHRRSRSRRRSRGATCAASSRSRAVVDPERATHVVRFERSVAGGAWTPIGTDTHLPGLHGVRRPHPVGARRRHCGAVPGHSQPSPTGPRSPAPCARYGSPGPQRRWRGCTTSGRPATTTWPDWGLHMWGDAVDPAVLAQIAWDNPWPRDPQSPDGWAEYDIPLVDDTKPVNFIMHLPSGDTVPTTREPGGDRSFVPLDSVRRVDQAGRPDGLHQPATDGLRSTTARSPT